MAAVNSDGNGDGGHHPRSSERDLGGRHRGHRSPSLSPPRHRRKRTRSPSVEKYRLKKEGAGGGRHGSRTARHGAREDVLKEASLDVIPEKLKKGSEDSGGEEGRGRVAKVQKDDRKSGKYAESTSEDVSEDSEEDSESGRDGRKKSRDKSRKHRHEKKSRSKRRSVHSESEQDEETGSEGTSGESPGDSDEDHKKAKRRKRRKQLERDERERERRRRKEKKRKLKEKEREQEKRKKKKEKVEKRSKGPITESWGKYGLIKEIDMWTKRPEFSAWLAEVKKVNLETLATREEKDMYKQYMEDYNTATFPSKKYYNIDTYHRRKVTKMRMKGMKEMAKKTERTEFNDEEQRRQELNAERAMHKDTEMDKIKRTMMQTGMGQAMREQAVLREEMQYHYRLGNVDAAAAIQRRLEPDVPGATY